MAGNCKFAFAVHVLSVLALHRDETLTSEQLAASVNTNPVVIRRLLCELSEAGLIEARRGPGGGTKLACEARDITLLQIHRAAAGEVTPFGEHPNEPAQCCPVGRGIRTVLEQVSERTRHAVEREYNAISLADVLQEMRDTDETIPTA